MKNSLMEFFNAKLFSAEMNKRKGINHQIVFWATLSILFVLRFPLLSWTTSLFPIMGLWIDPIYQIGTYIIIAFLIWWERDFLQIHHFDAITILIIIIFKPLSTILLLFINPENPLSFPKLLSLSFFIIAIILTLLLIKKKGKFKKDYSKSLLWFFLVELLGLPFLFSKDSL